MPAPSLEETLALVGTAAPASEFESQTLDFKRPGRTMKETLNLIADAAVCFANADGGTIVIGVDDQAMKRHEALAGVEPGLTLDIIRRGIFDRTIPPLTVFAQDRIVDGMRLVVVEVPSGIEIVSTVRGTTTRRLGKDCRPFTAAQQREVLSARGQLDWSAEASSADAKKASEGELERLRRYLGRAGHDEIVEFRDRPMLEALRLLENGKLTNAGALLLLGA